MDRTKEFFNTHAATWDARENPAFAQTIERILARFAPGPQDTVLDVACGTGILLPFLTRRGVSSYTALDFSEEMARRFREKHPGAKILVADFQQTALFAPETFSKIIIYNAFPHFSAPQAVFVNAYALLRSGGILCIAHAMNRRRLNCHHAKANIAEHRLVSDAQMRRFYANAGFASILTENCSYFYSSGRKP